MVTNMAMVMEKTEKASGAGDSFRPVGSTSQLSLSLCNKSCGGLRFSEVP